MITHDSVASPEEVETAKNNFWKLMGDIRPETRRNEPETWGNKSTWVPNQSNGIMNGPDIAHSDFLWNARLLPAVKRAFSAIWGSDDLIVSFDAGNVFRPWKFNLDWLTSVWSLFLRKKKIYLKHHFTFFYLFLLRIVCAFSLKTEWLVARRPKRAATGTFRSRMCPGSGHLLRCHACHRSFFDVLL